MGGKKTILQERSVLGQLPEVLSMAQSSVMTSGMERKVDVGSTRPGKQLHTGIKKQSKKEPKVPVCDGWELLSQMSEANQKMTVAKYCWVSFLMLSSVFTWRVSVNVNYVLSWGKGTSAWFYPLTHFLYDLISHFLPKESLEPARYISSSPCYLYHPHFLSAHLSSSRQARHTLGPQLKL